MTEAAFISPWLIIHQNDGCHVSGSASGDARVPAHLEVGCHQAFICLPAQVIFQELLLIGLSELHVALQNLEVPSCKTEGAGRVPWAVQMMPRRPA